MQVKAKSVMELAKSAHDEALMMEIVAIIDQAMADEGQVFTSPSKMSMVGYQLIDYHNTCYDGKWPVIAIAPQKSSVNVYVFAMKDGHYLLEDYISIFGKSNLGKSCIRIRKLNPERINALKEIVEYVKQT